ncbi:uncharacterized protein J4E84_005697 [Alternaria hordeiaustralica]|uniref:uncharacterized protein n=1 Tax=Alternaria hordeiaustralica TaxID=1187925 RepID=UPI0020C20B36|nr:uncharacterized protein J4E84_005697 [Alternaria hordeiaustralica]KAI4686418.1 hypothetical protein J4E84_005697 [Alternaria hordeiaustralica]
MISDHLQASPDEQYRVESDTNDTKQPPTNGGDQETPSCIICHHFANGVETSTPTADFIVSAGECQGCSIILQALDAVTDIRRPEFTTIDIRRKEAVDHWHLFDPQNVLNVACKQEGESYGGGVLFGRKYVDNRPNDYQIYTPVDAGEDSAIPWLGIRNSENDKYRELLSNLEDRLSQARSWFEQCKADHSLCAPDKGEWPRRVLDLATDPIRLVDSASIASASAQQQEGYACLSYAWGTTGSLKTLKSNLETHMQGIDISTLPRTLADAIHVCKAFGLRYLWIDALCIVQDDIQDWTDQIPRMKSIYPGAELVISAQSASSVQEGFLSLSPATNAPLKRIEVPFHMPDGTSRTVQLSIREREEQYWSNPAHHSSRPNIEDVDIDELLTPLATRAWVFQESFLARRILYATPSELAWQCSQHERCECRKEANENAVRYIGEDDHFFNVRTLGQLLCVEDSRATDQPNFNHSKLWAEIVKRYSEKRLTKWTDRLAAIQGVVGALQQAMPDKFPEEDYLFGLWKLQLEKWLLWLRPHRKQPGDSEAVATLRKMAPSWSWTTTIGNIMYYEFIFDPEVVTYTRVVNWEHKKPDSSETEVFGAGKCELTLLGFCLPVRLPFSGHEDEMELGSYNPFLIPERYASSDAIGPAVIDMIPDDPTDTTVLSRVTHFAPLVGIPQVFGDNPMLRCQGLFLEKIAGPEDEGGPSTWEVDGVTLKVEGTFKRVGFGYDDCRYMHLGWDDIEDQQSELRVFKLI